MRHGPRPGSGLEASGNGSAREMTRPRLLGPVARSRRPFRELARAAGLAAAVGLTLLLPRTAGADDACWLNHRGGPFPVCFDPGNRLHLDVAATGDEGDIQLGGSIQLRHMVAGDDPDVSWRLEHRLAAVHVAGGAISGQAYSGRYVRHSSDGHVVLPFGRPRKLFLPFDIGAEAEVGSVRGPLSGGPLHIGAVRTVALLELSRASHFRRRFAIGAAARWDLEIEPGGEDSGPRAHAVAPFSLAALDLRAESQSGLTIAGLRAEAGGTWSTDVGWRRWVGAEAEVERVFLALQDRPLSIFAVARFEPSDDELTGVIGFRLAPVVRIPGSRPL